MSSLHFHSHLIPTPVGVKYVIMNTGLLQCVCIRNNMEDHVVLILCIE